jgi:nuclear transport factor 2 (NTF2) superfamily protein
MPSVFLAECACDWKARSEEFGTSLRDWIDEFATKRWNFSKDDRTYKEIMAFVDLLCEKPFEQITQT